MFKKGNNLLIAASGTGGHIFPALTIAEEIDQKWEITWLGIKNRSEVNLVPKKYKLLTLNFKTPGKKTIFLIMQYIRILFSTFEIMKIINEKKITLIFTTGGYISAPTIIAGKISNIPVIIHESNLVPGLSTKYFGRFCHFVLTGFKETANHLKKCKVINTGTPIRSQFYYFNDLPDWVPRGKGPLILVMGGSQGAKGINEMLFKSLDFLNKNNFRVVHIVGESELIDLKKTKFNNYIQIKFTDQIASLMQNCDLVISRSGAGAINELIHTMKPSILIPFPKSKNDHQEKNALFLSSIGGSILIRENSKSAIYLKKTLERLFNYKVHKNLNNFEILELMKKNMSTLKLIDPREEIIKLINYFRNDF